MENIIDIEEDSLRIPSKLSKMDAILEMIEDEEISISTILRAIALEIGHVAKQGMGDDLLSKGINRKELNEQIKALTSLQKILERSDSLNKRDTLNLDGPKFRWIFGELTNIFKQAMRDAGIDSDQVKLVNLQFADLMHTHDERIRRELAKMDKESK